MVASADFTVNGLSVPPERAVAASSLVTLVLLSGSGADTIAWTIIGNHSHLAVNPAITPAGTPLGKTATFTMPAGASQAYLIQCQINGGKDSEGVEQAAYTKTAIVGVVNSRGVVPFAFGENYERSLTHGTTEALNAVSEGGIGSGDFVGPAGATSGHLVSFSSATGKAGADSGIATTDVILRTGAVPFTADQPMGGNKVTGLGAPSAGTDAVTKSYVDTIASGLNPRASVKAVATANQVTMTGTAQTVDGVALGTVGDRVLLTAQSTATQNGPWVIAAGAWTRPTDFLAGSDAAAAHFFVQQGALYADTGWVCSTNTGSAVVDANNLAFVQFSSAGVIVDDGATTQKTGNVLAVRSAGITATQIASNAVATAKIADDAVTYAKCQNVSATARVLGRFSASAGDIEEGTATNGVECTSTGIKLSDSIPARGTLNTAVDLVPSTQATATVNTGSSVTHDVALTSGKRYIITADVEVVDGSHNWLYAKCLRVACRNNGGTIQITSQVVVTETFNAATGFALTALDSGTNMRFTLANTNGTNRVYNIIIGLVSVDRP